jgi:hypothetical protein
MLGIGQCIDNFHVCHAFHELLFKLEQTIRFEFTL